MPLPIAQQPDVESALPYRAPADDALAIVASLATDVDAFLAGRSLCSHAHLASQMHRSALEALASLSNSWEPAAPHGRAELERALTTLYELQLYVRMAAGAGGGNTAELSSIRRGTVSGIEKLRFLLGLCGESVPVEASGRL